MKKWIHSQKADFNIDDILKDIVSIVVVDDATDYEPGPQYIESSTEHVEIDYSGMDREDLLNLPKKELQSISDINVLRKLRNNELTPN